MTDTPLIDPIETVILQLVEKAAEKRSISPADVAHAIDPENFKHRFGHVRQAAVRLAVAGKIVILRKGKPVPDAEKFKGVYRIGCVGAKPVETAE
jgi:hypothetical protein